MEFTKVSSEEPSEETNSAARIDDSEENTCGIGSFRPRWIQKLANMKMFLVLFCLMGIVEGALFTYILGVLSTWEKRYAFDSKISSFILISDNVSSIFISIITGHYGNVAHRPRWIATGMMIVGLGSLLSSSPYFIYGPGFHLLNRKIDLNSTSYQTCGSDSTDALCAESTSMTNVAIFIFMFSNFLNGFGYTAFYTVGTAYIDDNVKKRNSPLYFSTQMSIRLVGPVFGYILASFCLRFYENPSYDPGLTMEDPRWVGAWWMGFIILGLLLIVFSLPMVLFPRRLEGENPHTRTTDKNKTKFPKLKEIPSGLYRLIRNPIWFFHTVAIIFHVHGYMGYYILMPRYIEAHFRQTASGASFFSGSTSVVGIVVGIMLGGIVIRKFRPRPRILTAYMTGVAMCGALAMLTCMFIACHSLNIVGQINQDGIFDLENNCNLDCACTTKVFHPVCSSDGKSTYFSPCYAGCIDKIDSPGNKTILKDCSCDRSSPDSVVDLVSGYCPFDCSYLLPYLIILMISKLIGSTGRVGSMLINLRCVDPEDKNLSLGSLSAVLCAFAFIPYPLIYGALADSTCLVWESKCGKQGNCWIYDVDKLRFRLHGLSFALILVASMFDGVVCYYSKRMTGNFYDDEDGDDSNERISQMPLKQLQDNGERDNFLEKPPGSMSARPAEQSTTS